MIADCPYAGAYPWLEERRSVWREIARYVRRDAPDVGTLVELGPGYCDFINQFPASRKIGFDLNPEMAAFAASDARPLPARPADPDPAELPQVRRPLLRRPHASNRLPRREHRRLADALPAPAAPDRAGAASVLHEEPPSKVAHPDPTVSALTHPTTGRADVRRGGAGLTCGRESASR
jgi:hypothetical protein